ncbi:hypothetical protein [Candidatus Deferrimicrobium sp.]|uniref:hypothetical protein n=1 Tax=Candidatus Deferrimicrobium sp. TaxID=3060586 RepID=UPI002715DD74|nr:hypothetical protein [Candidatus Deferrimicrobium sp.]MDO8739359.1 hypothetical protein [Candidatus Deferrimicrobium sp.]
MPVQKLPGGLDGDDGSGKSVAAGIFTEGRGKSLPGAQGEFGEKSSPIPECRPHDLNFDPDLPVFSGWTHVLLPEALLLAALLAAGFFGLKKRFPAGLGILWFFLHLVPTNSFIPRLDVANERQLYLSSWGLFVALATGADLLRERWGGSAMPRRRISRRWPSIPCMRSPGGTSRR